MSQALQTACALFFAHDAPRGKFKSDMFYPFWLDDATMIAGRGFVVDTARRALRPRRSHQPALARRGVTAALKLLPLLAAKRT